MFNFQKYDKQQVVTAIAFLIKSLIDESDVNARNTLKKDCANFLFVVRDTKSGIFAPKKRKEEGKRASNAAALAINRAIHFERSDDFNKSFEEIQLGVQKVSKEGTPEIYDISIDLLRTAKRYLKEQSQFNEENMLYLAEQEILPLVIQALIDADLYNEKIGE